MWANIAELKEIAFIFVKTFFFSFFLKIILFWSQGCKTFYALIFYLLQIKKESIMHRSTSWNRFSDDYFKHATSSSSSSLSQAHRSSSNNLPTLDPIVELAKREKARVKFSENAVHAIPFVLLVCAVILWICSSPGELIYFLFSI